MRRSADRPEGFGRTQPRRARFEPAQHPALHPGRCARVWVDGRDAGIVGELHPRWRQAYELPSAPVLFELDAALLQEREVPSFTALPRQQSASRDLALVADDRVTHDALMQAIGAGEGATLVRAARLFDVYRPAAGSADLQPGERSLAVRLELRDDEQTLTAERIEAAVAEVLARLQAQLGVRRRG